MEASTSTTHDPQNNASILILVGALTQLHQNQPRIDLSSGESEASTATSHDPRNNTSASIPREEQTQLGQTTQLGENQPRMDLLSGELYFEICVPLYKAALEGNWKEANKILSTNRSYSFIEMLHMAITEGRQTILHVATGAGQTNFVKEILQSVKQHDVLTLQDENDSNAFCFAVAIGHEEIANLMLERNSELHAIRAKHKRTPLYLAVLFGQHKMANFLYDQTVPILNQGDPELEVVFFKSITTGLYDIALKLLRNHPNAALEVARDGNRETGQTALHMLARKPSAFADKSTRLFERLINSSLEMKFNCNTNSMTTEAFQLVRRLMEKITYTQNRNDIKQILKKPLFDAAELGNFEFLVEPVRSYPDLIHEQDEKERTIFQIAILNRHINIFNLIYETGIDMKLLTSYKDNDGNSMLHLAAIYPDPPPTSIVPGAALELQQELLMFKEVEKIIEPTYRDENNLDGKKPKELFTETHEGLRKLGEEWMKSTATSCMLVTTLIATVVFTSAFTVPGGSDDKVGRPILLNKTVFKVFVMSDTIALTSSCTSILMFLSILTSRYTEQDFLKSLPCKLILGLLTLFISVISMMVAFCSSIFLYYPYHERLNWMAMSTAFLVSIPIVLYGRLEYPLLRDIFYSTFGFRNRLRPKQILNKC